MHGKSAFSNREKSGATLAAFGFLLLALNLVDFAAGFDRIADWTAIIGITFTIIGAALARKIWQG